ncbi:protein-L-isoaspartate(D-aspartate) O-methyltransferase [Trifolium repens]|nr:protein-L-isoaspartate(D-aspartate) O-methyltransferase [Trifolium repens]
MMNFSQMNCSGELKRFSFTSRRNYELPALAKIKKNTAAPLSGRKMQADFIAGRLKLSGSLPSRIMSLASLPTPQENFETTDVCQQVHRRVLVKFLTSKFGFSNDEASRLTNDEIYKIMGDKYESFPKDEIKEICIDEIYNLPNAEFYDFFKAYSPKLLFPVLRNLCEFLFNLGKDKEVTTVLQLLAPQPTHQPTHRFFSKAVPFTGLGLICVFGVLCLKQLMNKKKGSVNITPVIEAAQDLQNVETDTESEEHNRRLLNHLQLLKEGSQVLSDASHAVEKQYWSNKGMVENLQSYGIIKSSKVSEVMANIDRGLFVPNFQPYIDCPMAIGYNATVSAPRMHATCLQLLENYLQPGMHALDVGSGTGYLTACFASMVGPNGRTVGVEHIPELVSFSIKNIEKSAAAPLLKDGSLYVHDGDRRKGWPEFAPYDAIHVGAAVSEIPLPLIDQLKPGGRMIFPIGNETQDLKIVDKNSDGSINIWTKPSVRYVSLASKETQLKSD